MIARFLCIGLTVLALSTVIAKADTWTDPTMAEMIEESDLIGTFRVVSGGPFKACLKAVKLLKGSVNGNIWLTGYSNKYGPINFLRPGEVYFLFVTQHKNTKGRFHSSSNNAGRFITNGLYKAYDFVSKKDNGYFVSTPTSGVYRVRKNTVYIDIARVRYETKSLPFKEFESMIVQSLSGEVEDAYVSRLTSLIEDATKNSDCYRTSNFISMLYYAGNKKFLSVFDQVSNDPAWEVRLALASALETIEDVKARNLLIKFVADSSTIVQGEAVRQLAKKESPAVLGPLLVSQLSSASAAGLYPSQMYKARKYRESGMMEILKAISDMKYTPAIPELLKVLQSESDHHTFLEIVQCLIDLGTTDYAQYLCQRASLTELSAFELRELVSIIKYQKLSECTSTLRRCLSKAEKADNNNSFLPESLAAIAADSQDTLTAKFIVDDFKQFFTYYDTLESYPQHQWLKSYVIACTTLKLASSREFVNKALYEWTTFDPQLFANKGAFVRKKSMEDSLAKAFKQSPQLKDYVLDDVICFLPRYPNDKSRFILEVECSSARKSPQARKKVSLAMGVSENNVFITSKSGSPYPEWEYRFNRKISILSDYIEYAKAQSDKQSLEFLKALQGAEVKEAIYFAEQISEAIKTIEAAP